MERVNLSSSSSISRIIYGMWRLADDINTSSKHISDKVNLCLDQFVVLEESEVDLAPFTAFIVITASALTHNVVAVTATV